MNTSLSRKIFLKNIFKKHHYNQYEITFGKTLRILIRVYSLTKTEACNFQRLLRDYGQEI